MHLGVKISPWHQECIQTSTLPLELQTAIEVLCLWFNRLNIMSIQVNVDPEGRGFKVPRNNFHGFEDDLLLWFREHLPIQVTLDPYMNAVHFEERHGKESHQDGEAGR
jgi:hypothetical protein